MVYALKGKEHVERDNPHVVGDSGEAERSFRKEAERHSGMNPNTIVATLASRLCKKCSASSRETCPERSGGEMVVARMGVIYENWN